MAWYPHFKVRNRSNAGGKTYLAPASVPFVFTMSTFLQPAHHRSRSKLLLLLLPVILMLVLYRSTRPRPQVLTTQVSSVASMSFSPDGHEVVLVGENGDDSTRQPAAELLNLDSPSAFEMLPTGQGQRWSFDGSGRLREDKPGTKVLFLDPVSRDVKSTLPPGFYGAAISSDGTRYARISENKDAGPHHYSIEAGYLRGQIHVPQVTADIALARPDDTEISFSPDGRYLAVKSGAGVNIWDTSTWAPQPLIHSNGAAGWDYWFHWSRDGRTLTAYGTLAKEPFNNYHWVYDVANARMLDHGSNDGQILPPKAGDLTALEDNGNSQQNQRGR